MLQVRRNFYNYTQIAGAYLVPSLIGSTLQNGDVLLYATSQVNYGYIVNGALVLATD